MNWEITYYNETVQNWVHDLPVGLRAYYARITERIVIVGPNLGLPYTRAMKDGLFEIRAKGKEGSARIFYCTLVNRNIMILHGFIKKTQKTPQKELIIARHRLQEVRHENSR